MKGEKFFNLMSQEREGKKKKGGGGQVARVKVPDGVRKVVLFPKEEKEKEGGCVGEGFSFRSERGGGGSRIQLHGESPSFARKKKGGEVHNRPSQKKEKNRVPQS